MNVNFKINLPNVENNCNETYQKLNENIENIKNIFLSGNTYNQLNSSNILNFNNYITNKKDSLFAIENSTINVHEFLKEVIKNHLGIDDLLSERPYEITEESTLEILSKIKKLSEYDNKYDSSTNNPIIDYKSNFNVLISKSNLNFADASSSITNIKYDYSYDNYKKEEELKFATPSSSIY